MDTVAINVAFGWRTLLLRRARMTVEFRAYGHPVDPANIRMLTVAASMHRLTAQTVRRSAARQRCRITGPHRQVQDLLADLMPILTDGGFDLETLNDEAGEDRR